jgi:chromosome partitioning protein
MKIISIASLKGGVGKTSLALFLGQAMAYKGKRVLSVDLDHNNNLTDFYLRDTDPDVLESRNVYHALTGSKPVSTCIFPSEFNIDMLPATPTVAKIGLELARDPGALLRFPSALRRLDYEVVIIDTPPALSFELTAALYAADLILCPVAWSRWTVQGFNLLAEECAHVSEGTGRPLVVHVVPSIVIDSEVEKLEKLDSWTMTAGKISKSAAIKNAGSAGSALRTASKSWEEFNALADEVLR